MLKVAPEKIEQASEKSTCKSGIFLCHIVRPLTQPNCLGIGQGLFYQASGTLQGHLSGMLMAFAYIFVDLLEGKGEVLVYFVLPGKSFINFYLHGLDIAWQKPSCILHYQESHSSNFN